MAKSDDDLSFVQPVKQDILQPAGRLFTPDSQHFFQVCGDRRRLCGDCIVLVCKYFLCTGRMLPDVCREESISKAPVGDSLPGVGDCSGLISKSEKLTYLTHVWLDWTLQAERNRLGPAA
jgi:hypothetical protein